MKTRAWRIYDKATKQMLYPKDMSLMGVFLTSAGDPVQYKGGTFVALREVVVLFATGMNTDNGDPIWDADILDVSIPTEYGSVIRARGIMKWDRLGAKWSVHIPNPPLLAPQGDFPVLTGNVVGNIYQQPDLLKQ